MPKDEKLADGGGEGLAEFVFLGGGNKGSDEERWV